MTLVTGLLDGEFWIATARWSDPRRSGLGRGITDCCHVLGNKTAEAHGVYAKRGVADLFSRAWQSSWRQFKAASDRGKRCFLIGSFWVSFAFARTPVPQRRRRSGIPSIVGVLGYILAHQIRTEPAESHLDCGVIGEQISGASHAQCFLKGHAGRAALAATVLFWNTLATPPAAIRTISTPETLLPSCTAYLLFLSENAAVTIEHSFRSAGPGEGVGITTGRITNQTLGSGERARARRGTGRSHGAQRHSSCTAARD